jgi:hypothetical protein
MKSRYYVQQGINTWLVLDRLKIKMHNDTVVVLTSRKAARDKARELNEEERRDRTTDQQLTVDGEMI